MRALIGPYDKRRFAFNCYVDKDYLGWIWVSAGGVCRPFGINSTEASQETMNSLIGKEVELSYIVISQIIATVEEIKEESDKKIRWYRGDICPKHADNMDDCECVHL